MPPVNYHNAAILYKCAKSGSVNDLGYIFPFIQSIQMDAIYAESAVLVDLSDRVLDSLFFESLDLIIIEHIKWLAVCLFCCKWMGSGTASFWK